MELPPSLGLGTINIAPFVEGLIFTKAHVWSLGMGMEGVRHSTSPVPWVGFHSLCSKS